MWGAPQYLSAIGPCNSPTNNKTRSVHMKLFQKSALAVAIAAVPFLNVNAMEALDDATLSEMTGQANVTIETTLDKTGITIGSIQYTDTVDSTNPNDIGGGSLLINGDVDGNGNGIQIQGWDPINNVAADSTSRRTIDINADGDLITRSYQIDGFGGAERPVTGKRIQVGNVNLQNAAGTATVSLVSNLDMIMLEAGSEAHILNLQGANSTRADMDVYQIDGKTVDVSKADGNIAIVTSSTSKIANLDVDALDGAVSIRGLSYSDTRDPLNNPYGLMSSTQVIWAKGGDALTDETAGVFIQGSDSVGTLAIDSIAIGGGTIGSVAITDISQKGSTMRIYGH